MESSVAVGFAAPIEKQVGRICSMYRGERRTVGRTVGFIDGTLRPIARPTRNQKVMYSGHKRCHGLKFQSVVTPDGIICHWSGPYAGSRHDAGILGTSQLLQVLEQSFVHQERTFNIYGDPAYPSSIILQAPFRGAHITEVEQVFNRMMSRVRVAVEWSFGGLLQLFPFLDYRTNLKLHLQPLGVFFSVATILFNCHTCFEGSVASSHFGVEPPSLNEYLNKEYQN